MSLIKKNRPFFIFLLKFGVSYLLFSGLYTLYLKQFDEFNNEPDGVTTIVAHQSRDLAIFFGEDASVKPHEREASYRFYINGKSIARIVEGIVEGCNAVSVMILFVAFIVAFSSTLKRTVLFIIAGLLVLHLLNVIRVALLCMGYYHYPQYKQLLHDIVFPLFIYGVVFILWILWVQKFSGNAKLVQTK
jgi:exosortase family protein XrtF